MSRLRPFFSYYGAKFTLAPHYPAPEHRRVVVNFAGSAQYPSLYPWLDVVLIDKSEIICGIWDYLINVSPAEVLALPDLDEGQKARDLPVPQEARWLIGFWCNRAAATPKQAPGAWAEVKPASFWGAEARALIASQVDQIRHWEIRHGDYAEQDPGGVCTRFIDPPYIVAGHHYPHGSEGIDYPALGAWCQAQQGQTIVCEAEGADWLPFRPFREVKATTYSGEDRRSREVVWMQSTCLPTVGQMPLFGASPDAAWLDDTPTTRTT